MTSSEQGGHVPALELQDLLDHLNRGGVIEVGSTRHRFMHDAAQDALRIAAQIDSGYRTPDEVRTLLADLTGKPVDDSVAIFPPFYSEFGKNLTLGKDVFINVGCRFPAKLIRATGFAAPAGYDLHADRPAASRAT